MRTRISAVTRPRSNRTRRTPRPAGREQGFSLLELTVVLLLMGLIMGLVIPGIYGTWKRERERATLRQLTSTLRTVRSFAVTHHRRIRVFFDLASGRYRVEGSGFIGQISRSYRLGEAHLVWQDKEARQGYIAFYGDGSSSGGYLGLMDGLGRRYLLDVEIITGRISLKTGDS